MRIFSWSELTLHMTVDKFLSGGGCGYSGWNLWVWLECIGVVSGCCCKEVYRFPHNITYPGI